MPPEILRVDPYAPAPAALARAAHVLQAGGLVAFPTETVYGLGANALDAAAVARIFAAKGRPAHNPLIVHVAETDDARNLASAWPAIAQTLAERFWPGPLTLVLPKLPHVPDLVTASGPTVAIRVPAHPVALALLRVCRFPIAAPSANRSMELSPTLPEHVLHSLGNRFDLLLDAGATTGGLESTVLDVTATPPRLLRPGLVTTTALEAILGPIARSAAPSAESKALRSPGLLERHYAPRTPLEIVAASERRVRELAQQGQRVGWLTHQAMASFDTTQVLCLLMPADSVSYSAQLYAALHQLDEAGLGRLIVEQPPAGEEWLAVHDRLRRASVK